MKTAEKIKILEKSLRKVERNSFFIIFFSSIVAIIASIGFSSKWSLLLAIPIICITILIVVRFRMIDKLKKLKKL